MSIYHSQWLYTGNAFGTPAELFNGARLARNLQAANLCATGVFDNILVNAGCDGYLYQPSGPAALNDPVLYLDAIDGSVTRQIAPNRGTGGPLLNATLGSTTGTDTNEPLWLGGTEKYLYVPGVAGNTATVPNTASLQVSGDLEIVVRVAVDNVANGATQTLLSKFTAASDGYELSLNATGIPVLVARVGGVDVSYSAPSALPTTLSGTGFWLKVTRVAATGTTIFYYSPSDGPREPPVLQLIGTSGTLNSGAIATGTSVMTVGARTGGATQTSSAKFFRTIVRATIGASTVSNALDINFTLNSSQSSFVATAGGTVTINRSTSGRKTVAYQGRPLWLFGTDDYMEITDSPIVEFDANEPFTVIAIHRPHNVAVGATQALITEQSTATSAGWGLYNGTAATTVGDVADGTATATVSTANKTASSLAVVGMVRNVTPRTITPYLNGVAGTPATDTTTATLNNAVATRIGSFAGGTAFLDAEVHAVLVWRRALSNAEMSDISAYFNGAPLTLGQCWTPVDFSATGNPWYDSRLPESQEAYGFYIETWTGLDGGANTRASSPTGQNRGGVYYGPQSHNERTWKLNVVLHGSTERGLEYLFRWLEGQLLNNCGTNCGAQHAWIRQVCPSLPETVPQEGVARAERVVLMEGPVWESPPAADSGCYIRRVSFTLGVGDPCLYREPAPLASADVTAAGLGTGNVLSNCATFRGSPRQVYASFSGPAGYGVNAPVVSIYSPAESTGSARKTLPVLRIAGYLDPNNTGDPCRSNLVGEIILEGAQMSGYEIVVDMARRRVRARVGGTTEWFDASRLIGKSLRTGNTRWWSFSPCDTGIVVVEPAYTNLENARSGASTALVVSTWSVVIETGTRFSCV